MLLTLPTPYAYWHKPTIWCLAWIGSIHIFEARSLGGMKSCITQESMGMKPLFVGIYRGMIRGSKVWCEKRISSIHRSPCCSARSRPVPNARSRSCDLCKSKSPKRSTGPLRCPASPKANPQARPRWWTASCTSRASWPRPTARSDGEAGGAGGGALGRFGAEFHPISLVLQSQNFRILGEVQGFESPAA